MSNLIHAYDIGDRELGSTVIVPFNSSDATGARVSITSPTFQIRELQTKSVYSGVNLAPDMDMSGVSGLNRVSVDTNDAFFRQGSDYILELTGGSIGGVDLTGAICGSFSLGTRADGLVLERTIKCHHGQVTAAISNREFEIDFLGVEESIDNFYARQEFAFQSGANSGIGQVCLKYDAQNKRVLTQEAYPATPEVGARFVIIPHERELRIYTVHIECEWGIGQGVGDRVTVTAIADGQALADPSSIIESMQVTTWDVGTDAVVSDEAVTPAANSGMYLQQSTPANARQPSEGLTIRATYVIDGITNRFQRTIFNYA